MARTIKSCRVKYLILYQYYSDRTGQLSFTNKKDAYKAWDELLNNDKIMHTRFVVLP